VYNIQKSSKIALAQVGIGVLCFEEGRQETGKWLKGKETGKQRSSGFRFRLKTLKEGLLLEGESKISRVDSLKSHKKYKRQLVRSNVRKSVR